jgi:hypothetical protein
MCYRMFSGTPSLYPLASCNTLPSVDITKYPIGGQVMPGWKSFFKSLFYVNCSNDFSPHWGWSPVSSLRLTASRDLVSACGGDPLLCLLPTSPSTNPSSLLAQFLDSASSFSPWDFALLFSELATLLSLTFTLLIPSYHPPNMSCPPVYHSPSLAIHPWGVRLLCTPLTFDIFLVSSL